MNLPAVVQRHRSLRWLAPAGVLCVAGLVTTGVLQAGASPAQLPKTTPAALLAAVRSAQVRGFSGTVLSQTSLGLPQLPNVSGDGADQTSFTSLLSGSHTLQVWYGGPDKQRIALLGSTDETDVFRNGSDMWEWSSDDHVARHVVLPERSPQHATPLPSNPSELTPLDLAQHLLGTLDPTTEVTVGGDEDVADRATYQLVLTPRTPATTIGSVRIAVDGATKVPLAVQVYPRSGSDAAIDVAFTSIRFGAQPARTFEFKPPAGATVQAPHAGPSSSSASSAAGSAPPRTTGHGWATVVGMRVGSKLSSSLQHGALDKAFVPVTGTWGSGRLLRSTLVSVLVTKDGRLFAGAVDPSGLYAAAGTK